MEVLPRGYRGGEGSSPELIVDTDVFSWATDPLRDGDRWRTRLAGVQAALAFPTVAEVHYGARKAGWGGRRLARLERNIHDYAVIVPDSDLVRLCGWLRDEARRSGHPLHDAVHANDLWIASCAVHYDLPLLTANVRHFAGLPRLRLAD